MTPTDATSALLRAALDFIKVFPDLAPDGFLQTLATGSTPAVAVVWADVPRILVSITTPDGERRSCEIPLTSNGRAN